MLNMRAALSDFFNEIGANYHTKESIGDFIGALGAAIEDGTADLYMGITSDTVYVEIRSQHRSTSAAVDLTGDAADKTGAETDLCCPPPPDNLK